ncbi:helix-turn-helix transcriptional regulator [Flavobacteriaceae bacterium TP-CH-4]|uniref:Helix-turn-helix transcriptional regulator n=1 Tax=Pelagihabitans pacificus TaxID=2696054 RepID=A0A967AVF4_9FLAO|nr:AraC family transcriptional regulator [Pelagihabitans pacificus]NHF58317.1 helix-turn-helix transcriptional regulator [Pelagihabitans pacificus]
MKPTLEQLNLNNSERSFRFFKREVDAFRPFWHYHPELEVTFISKGNGTRFVGNSIEPFTNMDLVMIGKNLPHHWVGVRSDTEEKQEAFVFQFNDDMFVGFKECSDFEILFDLSGRGIFFESPSNSLVHRILNFEFLNDVEQLCSLLLLMKDLNSHGRKRFLTSESYALMHNQKLTRQKFTKVNHHILENLDQKLTVNEMAEITHMVPQSFCRWFKKHSGHSFVNFLNLSRIERACQHLVLSSNPIQEIAFNCGFETISHFNRTFKKIKKISPREYRSKKYSR